MGSMLNISVSIVFLFIYGSGAPYLHLTGIPRVLDRLDPANVGDAPVQERAGLANKHAQSQRCPVRLCKRERERYKRRRESRGMRERERDDVEETSMEMERGEVSLGIKKDGRGGRK